MQNKREFLPGDVNPLQISDEKDSADDDVSRSTISMVQHVRKTKKVL